MTTEITPEAIAAEYDQQEYNDWLFKGVNAGWVSPVGCMIHNPVPLTEAEEAEFEAGYDPCVMVMRVWKE